MQIPIYGDWLLSIVLSKGQYASCLNPHVLLCKRGVYGFGVRFPPHWRIWNVDLDRKRHAIRKRSDMRKLKGRTLALNKPTSKWCAAVSVFVTAEGEVSAYLRLPFLTTRQLKFKSAYLRRLCFAE